jgi:hypothetical protein
MSRANEPFDPVQKPKHYNVHPSSIECYTYAKHFTFSLGNAIKYLWRAGLKDGQSVIVELSKALWYLRKALGEAARADKDNPWALTESQILLNEIKPHHNADVAGALQRIWDSYFGSDAAACRSHLGLAIRDVENEMRRQQEPIVRELEGLPHAAELQRAVERVKSMTPGEVFQASVDAGIHNPDGTLTDEYKPPNEPE